jgi:RNA polymerase sigma-70 factor (ECF subfamily)
VGRSDDGEIYAKYADELVRFATGLVGPSHAQDVVSGAVVRCLGSRSWATVRNPRAYLYRSVWAEARMAHRGSLRRQVREQHAAPPESAESPDVQPEILRAVASLSLRQRAVIVLTYWADLDPPAVAEFLGIREGSVRRHLARARARLREVLHDWKEGPE